MDRDIVYLWTQVFACNTYNFKETPFGCAKHKSFDIFLVSGFCFFGVLVLKSRRQRMKKSLNSS